jgi:thioredoxin 1
MLSPVMEELSVELRGIVKMYKFNVDDGKETPAKFGIMSVPTLILLKDGKLVAQRSGMASKKIIQDWISSSLK